MPNLVGSVILHGLSEANIIGAASGVFYAEGGSTTNYRSPNQLTSVSGASSYGAFTFNAGHVYPDIYQENINTIHPACIYMTHVIKY